MAKTNSKPRKAKASTTAKGRKDFAAETLAAQRAQTRALNAVANATYAQTTFAREAIGMDPRRSINDECGYPDTASLTIELYKAMYERNPVAARVVEVMPKESWKMAPSVFENNDPEVVTTFEEAFSKLGRNLSGEEGWYQDDEGGRFWEYLKRVDIRSGIGSFGLLLLGLDDGLDLNEPAAPKDGQKLMFMRVFDESQISIATWDDDKKSRRYGKPLTYNVSFDRLPRSTSQPGASVNKQEIHWTRMIHVVDELDAGEVFGVSRMRVVWNRLYDIDKILSSDAESYWRNVMMKLFFETHPQLGGDVQVDDADLRTMMERLGTGLQTYGRLSGMSVKAIAPSVVDPTAHVDAQIQVICIEKEVPKRIFMGSERGELSSAEDKGDWYGKVAARNISYTTPRLVAPTVDRLIWLGVLPTPTGYSVVWPDLAMLGEEERAPVAKAESEAIAAYVQSGGAGLITPMDFLTKVLRWTDEDAKAALEASSIDLEKERKELGPPGQQGDQGDGATGKKPPGRGEGGARAD